MDEQKKILDAVASLQQSQTDHLNRLLALEAVFDAILTRVDPKVIAVIADAYDSARDRLAANLHPLLQRPEHWDQWTDRLEELRKQPAVRDTSNKSSSGLD